MMTWNRSDLVIGPTIQEGKARAKESLDGIEKCLSQKINNPDIKKNNIEAKQNKI